VVYRLKPDYMSQSGRPLLRNVYNKNAYFSGNGVKTNFGSRGNEYGNHRCIGNRETKDSTRCLLDRPADGCNRQIQTEADRS
jgi:hypothetical protein